MGDINNDGLSDVFFTGNMVKNRLYLIKGDFEFEDVSEKSGTGLNEGWKTGVSLVDINDDGWIDIFLVNGSRFDGRVSATNRLYRNKHDGTFTDVAVAAGVAFSEAGVARAGMGIDVADYDGSGRPSPFDAGS